MRLLERYDAIAALSLTDCMLDSVLNAGKHVARLMADMPAQYCFPTKDFVELGLVAARTRSHTSKKARASGILTGKSLMQIHSADAP